MCFLNYTLHDGRIGRIKFLERGTNKNYTFKGTFHEAMSPGK